MWPLIFKKGGNDFYSAEVEVFAVGVWNKDRYTTKDLDQMVEAFNALQESWKPTIKIGHGKQLAEQPALGYVEALKRVGEKLIAHVVNIPKIVKEAIEKGLFKKRSAEIYWNYKDNGKVWPRVLKAVALLGASIPAVTSLKDIEKFFGIALDTIDDSVCRAFTDCGEGEIKEYDAPFAVDIASDMTTLNVKVKEVSDKVVWEEGAERVIARLRPREDYVPSSFKIVPYCEGISYWTGELRSNPDVKVNAVHSWVFDKEPHKWNISKAQAWLTSLSNYKSVENNIDTNISNKDKEESVMDWEKLFKQAEQQIKELQEKIKELTDGKNVDANKLKELNETLKAKTEEAKELKAFKEEADKAKQERDTAMKALDEIDRKRHADSLVAFIKEHTSDGKVHILPRDVDLVTAILEACPREKKFKRGETEVSLLDMVMEYISKMPNLLKLEELTKKDQDKEYKLVSQEVDERTKKYQHDHPGTPYSNAMRIVLDTDADLKQRYAEERAK